MSESRLDRLVTEARAAEPGWDEVRERRVLAAIQRAPRARPRRRYVPAGLGVAAMAAAAALGWLWLGRDAAPELATASRPERSAAQLTGRLELADGSVCRLSPDARVRVVAQSDRLLRLEQTAGSVEYDVSHRPSRAFEVLAEPAVVRVRGTRFTVTVGAEAVSVSVAEGRVEVEARQRHPALLTAGDAMRVARSGAEGVAAEGSNGAPQRELADPSGDPAQAAAPLGAAGPAQGGARSEPSGPSAAWDEPRPTERGAAPVETERGAAPRPTELGAASQPLEPAPRPTERGAAARPTERGATPRGADPPGLGTSRGPRSARADARTSSVDPRSARAGSRPEPSRSEPSRSEPSRSEPSRSEPSRSEPSASAASPGAVAEAEAPPTATPEASGRADVPAVATEPAAVEDAAALLARADEHRRAGRSREAVAELERLLRTHPSDARVPSAAFTLGRLQRRLGNPRLAAEAFARARAAEPQGSLAEDALAEEADAWAASGQAARARQAAQRYLAAHPHGLHATRMRALAER